MKNWGLNIGVIITLLTLLIGGVSKFNSIQAKTQNTEERVKEVKEKVEKTDEELTENEKIDLRQSMLIEQIAKTLDKLNEKIDKDITGGIISIIKKRDCITTFLRNNNSCWDDIGECECPP